jgi:hypothetical protein
MNAPGPDYARNSVSHTWTYTAPHIPDVAKKKVDDAYQVTEWGHPYEMIESARFGPITYKRYLELESVRWMETNLRDSWLRENKEGLVALFSWRKYAANVVGDDPK